MFGHISYYVRRLHPMKILLVEDSRAMAALMAARLQTAGHEVTLAENGEVALEKFSQSPPELVLMDIEMPVMNGFEATNRIRTLEAGEAWAWTPIIFLTASDAPENLVTAIDAGADDYIVKTAPESVLHAKMKAMSRIATLREKLSEANNRLAELASRDGLTGLFNRRHMDILLDAAWAQAVPHGTPFGLLMVDADNFKKYNDHYGHQAGDQCLCTIAEAIAAEVERSNTAGKCDHAFVARYGGEEFAVVVPGASEADFHQLASDILEGIRRRGIPHPENEARGTVSISIGGAYLAVAGGKLSTLFRSADARLYQAKENGRNCLLLD